MAPLGAAAARRNGARAGTIDSGGVAAWATALGTTAPCAGRRITAKKRSAALAR